MLARLKYKVGDDIAEEIPEAIEFVKQRKRENLLKKLEPVTITKNYGGLFNPRHSSPNYKPIKYKDQIEDDEREFWNRPVGWKKYY